MAEANISKKRMRVKPLSQEYLRELLEYNPETGEFRWKPRETQSNGWNTRQAGKIAGCLVNGYIHITIWAISYCAHHLAWLAVTGEWPEQEIDHRDLNRSNNRFNNLRKATYAQNNTNKKKSLVNNTSGYKGVWRHKKKYWRAGITVKGKRIRLGYYKTPEEAYAAYCKASKKYHGEFGRVE